MATRNQNRSSQAARTEVGMRVPKQRYGLIEWNGLSGFVSYGLEPAARTGRQDESGPGILSEDCRSELGRVSEPMN